MNVIFSTLIKKLLMGYSDDIDNWLLAPSRDALQEMLVTCEEYAEEHKIDIQYGP